MAMFTSDINRVTGLSGIDTESMVEKMMKAESMKYNRLEKQKTSVTWQQESFRQLIKSMQGFQDKWFNTTNLSNNIGYDAFWNNYKTSVKDATTGADSNVIKINSSNSTGKFEIEVKQQAQTESIAGQATTTEIIAGKPSEVLEKLKKYKELSINVNLDGATQEIKLNYEELKNKLRKDPTGDDLVNDINEKLKTAFGTDAQQTSKGKVEVQKQADDSLKFILAGNGHNLTISDSATRTEGVSTTITGALKDDTTKFEITIDGQSITVEFDKDKHKTQEDKLNAIYEKLKSTNDKDSKPLNRRISIERNGDDLVIKNRSETNEISIKDAKVTNSTGTTSSLTSELKLNPTGSLGLFGFKTTTNVVSKYASLSDIFGDKFKNLFENGKDEIKLNFGGKNEVTINKDDSIQSLINKINSTDSGVKLEFNDVTNRFTLSSSQSGANGRMNITDKKTKKFLKDITGIDVDNKTTTNGQQYTAGQDAIFKVDGVETTRATNDITMNGINFTINGIGKVKVEVSNDIDTTVKKVKEFVEDYNKLIEEVNNAFVEKRPKSGKYGYFEPLTDEEKKGMSEDEIKKYEENAKKGLLNGDENINKFLASLRDNVYKSVDIGGKTISLYEIGITTTKEYNDGGKLQIDEEKLKTALKERGDDVRQLFTSKDGISNSIKADVDNAIGSKGYLRKKAGVEGSLSASNNDLTKELEDITKRLAEERERLYNKEMYYFDLFAKMESSMNQQNSQMAVLLGMSGQ